MIGYWAAAYGTSTLYVAWEQSVGSSQCTRLTCSGSISNHILAESITQYHATRGGAIILRVGSTNITASEVSRKILGVVPPHDILGYNSCKETHKEPIRQR